MNALVRLLLLLALPALAGVATAQPIFVVDPDHTFGGFIGPTLRVGSLFRQPALFVGGITAFVVDRRLAVGIEGTSLCGDVVIHPTPQSQASLRMLYGGIVVGYSFGADLPVHPLVRATLGGGGVRPIGIVPSMGRWQPMALLVDVPVDGPDDAFALLEPGIGLEAILGAHTRVELTANYRIVTGIATDGLDNSDIGGASMALTAKLGLW